MTLPDTSDRSTSHAFPADTLPEYWPDDQPPEPVRAIWLPWPIAIVLAPLFWLMPKRMGPHFAAVRWPGIIAAHLLWATYGFFCIVNAYANVDYSWAAYLSGQCPGQQSEILYPAPTLSQIARSPLAVTAYMPDDPMFALAIAMAGAVVELGVALAAITLIAYAVAGERELLLFARCLRLTWWSTTSLVVLGLALQVIELDLIWEPGTDSRLLATGVAVTLYVAWFVWLVIRSGLRYAGPAERPGRERRRPQCEQCGYTLTGLTADVCCPECGNPIADSLPGNRQPTPFAAAETTLARIPAFFRTAAGALAGRGFYKHLTLYNQHAHARRFAIWTCVLCGPVFCAAYGLTEILTFGRLRLGGAFDGVSEWSALAVLAWTPVTVSALMILGFFGSGVRYKSPRALASVAMLFYFAAWLLPSTVAVGVGAAGAAWMIEFNYVYSLRLGGPGTINDPVFVFLAATHGLPFLVVVVLGVFRLIRARRQTRFANA